LAGITKGSWRVEKHEDIAPAIFAAYERAVTGMPGPVFVEIPVNLQLFQGEVAELPVFRAPALASIAADSATDRLITQAVDLLVAAQSRGLFVGWGAVDVSPELQTIATQLGAPVSTTLQGLSTFPGNHPLHTGMGFSRAAVPAAENAFKHCD